MAPQSELSAVCRFLRIRLCLPGTCFKKLMRHIRLFFCLSAVYMLAVKGLCSNHVPLNNSRLTQPLPTIFIFVLCSWMFEFQEEILSLKWSKKSQSHWKSWPLPCLSISLGLGISHPPPTPTSLGFHDVGTWSSRGQYQEQYHTRSL